MHKAMGSFPMHRINPVWWHVPVMALLGKYRHRYQKFKVVLNYAVNSIAICSMSGCIFEI